MTAVTPRPVGEVQTLVGTPLRAEVELSEGEELAGYEIELVDGRRGGRAKAWAEPLWQVSSDAPRFASLDGHGVFEGMLIGRRRPKVEVQTTEPMDAYSWVLRQDGEVIDEGVEVSEGIAEDGLSFEFRPGERLRRSGQPGPARREGVFYPPFESHLPGMPRAQDSRIHYTAVTHAGHDDHDAYAVDFNWGSGGADRGHWVRSAATGRVSRVDPANGQVHIRHPRFDGEATYETVYAHLDPVLVKKGDRVRAQQRIGRIGSAYHGDAVISPHLHHQHLKDGEPVKMKLLIHGQETPIGASRKDPGRTIVWDRKVPGWIQPRGPAPARLLVRTRGASSGEWSPWGELRFTVARGRDAVPKDQDALFDAARAKSAGTGPDPEAISHQYDGPALEPGGFSVRYRAIGDAGTRTPWAYDKSVVVEPALA